MKLKRIDIYGYTLIFPAYSIYLLFVLYPVFLTIYISFTKFDLFHPPQFAGFDNYIRLTSDPFFLQALLNTFVYSFFTIVPQIVLGLLIAVVLNDTIKGKGLLRMGFFVPHLVSMVSVSMVWLWIYDPNSGFLNKVLEFIGLPPQLWLHDGTTALGSLVVLGIWKAMGYNMLIYLAGLQQIPDELYEAAEIEGASGWQKLTQITVPLLHPTTFFLLIIAVINSFSVFEQVNVMTEGGPVGRTSTIVHQLYIRAFQDYQMGYASSMGVVLILITVIITAANFRFGKAGKGIE